MSRLSSPMILMLVVVVGWTAGRASYVGWNNAMSEEPRGAIIPVPMLPLGALSPLTIARSPQVTAGPAIELRQGAARAAMPVAPRNTALSPQGGYGSAREGGGEAPLYVRQQLALLHAMLNSARSANSAPFGAPPMPQYGVTGAPQSMIAPAAAPAAIAPPTRRWALSAWAFHRAGGGALPLASQGQLGGSQAGARLSYRLDRDGRASLFARLSAAPQGVGSAEGAIGVAVRPMRAVPLSLVVERRARLSGNDARSAFAAYVAGGVSDVPIAGGFRLDAYGAAGVVGARRRDGFAEGQAQIMHPILRAGPLRISAGGGAWGGAQPGLSRLDVGPTLVTRLDGNGTVAPRLSVDYRRRVAGDAAPGSGVAITLAADF